MMSTPGLPRRRSRTTERVRGTSITAVVAAQTAAGDDRVADAAHLIRSMIAAANADGTIDSEERAGILQRAMEAGLDSATQQFLMGELRAPASAI